jgi:outer membrane protein OmpA-like peptidoglycan-associated protein
VLPEEVCYLSYFPDYTLGITVTSPGYLPHSLKVDPSLEYKTSRQTEKIVFLDNAVGQTVRSVTNDMSAVPSSTDGDAGNSSASTIQNNNSGKGRPVILKNVFFGFDSNELSEVAMRELELVYESQKNAKSLTIIGHTDSQGPASYNQGLSERRAAEVADFMRELGFRGKLNSIGKGETAPIATNETAAGRGKNRRVEIVITY